MNPLYSAFDKLQVLVEKWEGQAFNLRQYPHLTPEEEGFAAGLEKAVHDLRTLIAQISGLPLTSPYELENGDLEINFAPSEENEPDWEYLYVRFEQTPDGEWYLKDVNGFWHSPWKTSPTFAEAVEQLRNKEGWRLVSFAKGIHIFRRPSESVPRTGKHPP